MEITFTKGKGGRSCSWSALRPPRTRVPGPTMAAGGDLPHDLATFVIERALGLDHGFWGCVADGATFKTLGRKRTPQGRQVIDRHAADLDAAEVQVNAASFAWRRGEPTPVDDDIEAMLARWRALGEGESLQVVWERPEGRQLKRSRRGSSV